MTERYSFGWLDPREVFCMYRVYIYPYNDKVRVQFGDGGPWVTVEEKDMPDKMKYGIAARGIKSIKQVGPRGDQPTVALDYGAKDFNELAASMNLMLSNPAPEVVDRIDALYAKKVD